MAIRMVIADDHSVVRQGLKMFLGMGPELDVVGEATNSVEAVELARQLQPNVVLMDLLMPVMDDISAISAIRSEALTERETDVLRLLAQGKANKQIARDLGIGEKTVKTHVSNILAQLHVPSRTQAALYAVRAGLVSSA